ncbi:MAG: diacylglycerol kinase [Magnetococcales bacterium]|nr:diacylglycerol kinase [Magnetococcales bacterium]
MIQHKETGIRHFIKATGWSMSGLQQGFREAAFRQELLAFMVLVPLAFWLGRSGVERALLIGSLFPVLVAELLNTAIEAAIDRIGPEHHPLSGRAKDLGSAAVFIALLGVAVVWGLVLLSP